MTLLHKSFLAAISTLFFLYVIPLQTIASNRDAQEKTKLYLPLLLWNAPDSTAEACKLSGADGVFIIYHLQNQYDGITKDSVCLNTDVDNVADTMESLVMPLRRAGVKVKGLMFHCEGKWDDTYYSDAVAANYRKFIINKVKQMEEYFPEMEIIYICNEQEWFFDKDRKLRKGWIHCLEKLSDEVHALGFKTGIKYSSWLDGDVKSVTGQGRKLTKKIDYHSLNLYPYGGKSDKTDLYNQEKMQKEADGVIDFMNAVRKWKPDANLTITESGVMPYAECLPTPAQWATKGPRIRDNEIVEIYYNTVLKILDLTPYDVEFIGLWYTDAVNGMNTDETFKVIRNCFNK